MPTAPAARRLLVFACARIGRRTVRQLQQIIYARFIKLRKFDQNIQRILDRADLILLIGVLSYVQYFCDVSLRQASVLTQIPYSLIEQNFVLHSNHLF